MWNGKSRLTEEFIRQARLLGVKTFLGAGDSIEQNNPYFSWRTVFNQLFGIEDVLSRTELSASDHEAIQAAVLSKLDEVDPELTSYAPLLNVVLPIALPENELTIICSDLKQAIFLGDRGKMIIEAFQEFCGTKSSR